MMRRKRVLAWIVCVFCLYCTVKEMMPHMSETTDVIENDSDTLYTAKKLKRILYWNNFFKSNEFKFGLGQTPFIENNCSVQSCFASNDKATLADVDVIVFHGPQIEKLPDFRDSRHIYVYVQKEPWMDMSDKLMGAFNDIMNLTMTYREDSDILLPYATVTKLNIDKNVSFVDIDPKSKPKSVVWAVSHCKTDSKREIYVNELKKYIDVDIYGECGDLECDKHHNGACWNMFAENYRFVIAMENDVCKDYITEKAYRPFSYNIVPIVFGGANYDEVTPPHSVIDIRNFPHPKHLAKYLNELTRNRKAYNEYFRWKAQNYHIESYRRTLIGQSFCRLCELLHDENYQYKRYDDIRRWWVQGSCNREIMKKFKSQWK